MFHLFIILFCSFILFLDVFSLRFNTIDHLYPIHKVKNSSFRNINRELLKKFDIEDINDCKNLVAACSSCNKRKSKKTGLWLIRGYLGKYPLFWKIAYYVLILSLCLGIFIMLFN